MGRGIYIVANKHVERLAANLVYSIRQSGCTLPISLIPYDENIPNNKDLLAEVTLLQVQEFPQEAQELILELRKLWPGTSPGLFRRFLSWYGPYDEFIYSDNDIVALGNWEVYLENLGEADLVHADEEYTTKGVFNYRVPSTINSEFGQDAFKSLITAGHFASRKNLGFSKSFRQAIEWIERHPGVAKEHDQAFLHLAVLLGSVKTKNFCQAPFNWPSPWAGDYRNTLDVVQTVQRTGKLFQLHYSGGLSNGYEAREDFLYASCDSKTRLKHFVWAALSHWSGLHYLSGKFVRGIKRRLSALLFRLQS